MNAGLLGKKVGMTRIYNEQGVSVPVTVIEAGPCTVIQVKTEEKDGYKAVQVGFMEKRDSLLKKPEYYHFEKHKCSPARYIGEFKISGKKELKTGDVLTVELVKPGDKVDISGISKGRGFQGVVKRWGFKGGKASHGAETHRHPGSIGMSADPSRVLKNKKMPGHMGHSKVTVKNCEVVSVDSEKNIICVKGAVPGHRDGLLRIQTKEGSS